MKRARGTLGGLLFLVGSMLWAPSAAAGGSRLVYGRTAGSDVCPAEVDLRAAVRERLGYDPFFPWAEQTIVVHIAPRPHRRIGGKVYLVDSAGRASPEREFTTSEGECRELVLALALAIVMTLDPLHGTPGAAPPPAKPPADAKPPAQSGGANRGSTDGPPSAETSRVEPSSPAAAGDAAPAASPAAPLQAVGPGQTALPEGADRTSSSRARAGAPSSRFSAELGGALFVASGVTPGISTGFIPSLRGRAGDFSVSLEGRLELPMWSSFDSDRVDASLVGGSVVPCVHWKPLVWCGTMLLGRYQAEGRDVAARSANALFAAVGARLSAEMPMSSNVWGFVRVEGLVNLTRHELVVAAEPIWRVPPVGFTLSAGALTSFL
ncbi:MAG: hypothetical protein ABW133_16965 [Polyangiaceae bacterium]